MIKELDIDNVLSKLKQFPPSLNFTVYKFDNGVAHLKTIDNETDIYYKDTRIHILVNTCTFPVTHLGISKQLGLKPCIIKLRKYVVIINHLIIKLRKLCHGMDSLLNCLKSNSAMPSSNNIIKWNGIPEITFRLSYARKVGEKLLKSCLQKVKHCLSSNVKFRVLYDKENFILL